MKVIGHPGYDDDSQYPDDEKVSSDLRMVADLSRQRDEWRLAIEKLTTMWRSRADIGEACHRDTEMPRRERAEHAGESRTFGLCANELEAALHIRAGGLRPNRRGSPRCKRCAISTRPDRSAADVPLPDGGSVAVARDPHRRLKGREMIYREALERIRHIAEGHHGDQPAHIWYHALTIDIPAMVDAALGAARLRGEAAVRVEE